RRKNSRPEQPSRMRTKQKKAEDNNFLKAPISTQRNAHTSRRTSPPAGAAPQHRSPTTITADPPHADSTHHTICHHPPGRASHPAKRSNLPGAWVAAYEAEPVGLCDFGDARPEDCGGQNGGSDRKSSALRNAPGAVLGVRSSTWPAPVTGSAEPA